MHNIEEAVVVPKRRRRTIDGDIVVPTLQQLTMNNKDVVNEHYDGYILHR